MLTLKREAGEEIVIGNDIKLTVKKITRKHVTLTIEAPKKIVILRAELLNKGADNGPASSSDDQ